MASMASKYLFWPGLYVLYRSLTDRQDGLCWFEHISRLYESSSDNFIVSAATKNKDAKKEKPCPVPSYPLPEYAEYAGKLSCGDIPKRKRMFVAHMFCNTNKKALDAHKDYLCKHIIDPDAEFVICPSIAYLDYVDKTFPQCVKLGVQNIYPKDEGNYTGEVSLPMAKELGASYVLIGTRHRRRYLGESDKFLRKKIQESLKHGMKCVVFVNVTNGSSDDCSLKVSLKQQIKSLICALEIDQWEKISVACESPPYRVEEGKEESIAKKACRAQKMCKMVRQLITNGVGDDIASRVQILYSGDVCHASAPVFMSKEDIDGIVFCPKTRSECFVNIVNSGLVLDQRRKIWPPEEPKGKKKKKKKNEEEEPVCEPRKKEVEEECEEKYKKSKKGRKGKEVVVEQAEEEIDCLTKREAEEEDEEMEEEEEDECEENEEANEACQ